MPRSGPQSAAIRRARTWWTRDRVLAGLRRFYEDHGEVITSMEAWSTRLGTRGGSNANYRRRRYPSFYGVLRYFDSFRQAWEELGIDVDRYWEPWSELEDWYLREAIGHVPREEIARDLRRSDGAVKRRLYDLGLLILTAHGWSPNRIERVASLSTGRLNWYLDRGMVPYYRGTKVLYIDPADLVGVVQEIDWKHPPAELEEAARHSLQQRLVQQLSGQDWQAGRPYRFEPKPRVRNKRTRKHWNAQPHGYWHKVAENGPHETLWRLIPAPPRPVLDVGHRVSVREAWKGRQDLVGRVGHVVAVVCTIHLQGEPPVWCARLEYKRDALGPRVHITIPISSLETIWRKVYEAPGWTGYVLEKAA